MAINRNGRRLPTIKYGDGTGGTSPRFDLPLGRGLLLEFEDDGALRSVLEGRPNHVRDGSHGRFDMTKVEVWERLAFLVRADAVHSIQFKVLDVNRRDA